MNGVARLRIMYGLYGVDSQHTCKTCCNLTHANGFYKCKRYGVSASQASDWNSRGTACGKWNKPKEDVDRPAMYWVGTTKKAQKTVKQVDGQIGMEV